ncbi:L,D-transpeptidase family protein [Rhodopirellula halodulae]|uniref:L,D-transpeptidase family protein n=1 Tax=Rhodopirellula halodulae TaxID=2894198 RepID=UPI001E4A71DE|nr:L,D-transpeptidase family protein [Rhodopirellula sp. JC737]MCC9656677.1 LysM peptidoglycan-binding domain-containing protein [Rhodopirellula sp. JC737]
MQTLKTAAIVVLMTTVLYGAWISMTTPPDALPPEVARDLIVDADTFDISDGIPDSLDPLDPIADLGIDDGMASSDFAGNPNATTEASQSGFEDLDMALNQSGDGLGSGSSFDMPNTADLNAPNDTLPMDSVDRSFADLPANGAASTEASNSFSMSDLNEGEDEPSASRLPEVEPGTSTPIQLDPNQEYASTGTQYENPDPSVAVSATESMDDVVADASPTPTESQATDSQIQSAGLTNAIATADRQYHSDRRREALATLSLFYETPNLTSEQRQELLIRLDPLAREVIYSDEHLIAEPHRVGPNETLMDIAKQYEVPWQLLANINEVEDPITVLPGTDLKVVRGPFRADVDLKNQELTMFLGDLYAGRFSIAVGSDPSPRPGSYTIQEKQSAKTYYDMSGTPIPPGNPRNPYGSMWIDLGSGLSIHGSPEAESPTNQGCISVAGNYSRDVFGILSEGSSVTIR